jgi:hypothetical protein
VYNDAPEPEVSEPKKRKAKRMSDEDMKMARERYERGINREQKNREDARSDLKFKVGDQWDEAHTKLRGDRPTLTFNRQLATVRQVTGDIRQNKPAIRVRPNGDGADKDTAEMFGGLIRNIEQQSHAGYVYAQAGEASTSCGFGYFRIVTEYATADSFTQDIRLKGIPNPLSVVCDPDAQELDRSDAKWWFIYSKLPKEDFEKQYPKAQKVDFEKLDRGQTPSYSDWFSTEGVRIAEYWCKEPVTKTVALLDDGRTVCLDDYEDDAKLNEVMGSATIVREREVKTHRVMQHIISGAEELEDPVEWATDDIPIIPVLGEETWVDENRVSYGLIRFAKDPQRAYNYVRSTSVEVLALQPKSPYVLSSAMIEGYETMWQNAGNANYPYLLFKSDPNLNGKMPERIQPPVPAAGLLAEAAQLADDMKSITGIYDASLGARSNETSGRAIEKRQREGDVSTFVYIDNLALAISCCGRQLVKLIPKIYDTHRMLRVLYEDGTEETIKANVPGINRKGEMGARHDPQNGFYDLTIGKYDVVVDAGPGFTTRRQEAADGLKEFMQILGPQGAALFAGDLARLQDWPGSVEIAEKAKRLLPPQLQDPQTGPDGQPVPPPEPPPPPEVVKAQAQMAMDKQRHEFDVAKAQDDHQLKQQSQQAEIMLARQKAEAEAQLARDKAEADAKLARDKAEFEMMMREFEAQHGARLSTATAIDHAEIKRGSTMRQGEGGEAGEAKQGSDLGAKLDAFLQKMESMPQMRRRFRTYRDQNDNLIGEEEFVPEGGSV